MNSLNDNKNQIIGESLLLLDTLYFELHYYEKQLELLEKNKPFFFQKKKLLKYKNQKNNLEIKINEYKNKIKTYIDLQTKT